MMIFGHLGITIGAFRACELGLKKCFGRGCVTADSANNSISATGSINYAVVAIGALLPDLIDKPLTEFLYGLERHDSHLLAHKPGYAALLLLIGVIALLLWKMNGMLVLGLATMLHQLLDKGIFLFSVNSSPELVKGSTQVLLGMGLPGGIVARLFDSNTYFSDVMLYLMVPYVFVSEMLGLLLFVSLAVGAFRRHRTEYGRIKG